MPGLGQLIRLALCVGGVVGAATGVVATLTTQSIAKAVSNYRKKSNEEISDDDDETSIDDAASNPAPVL